MARRWYRDLRRSEYAPGHGQCGRAAGIGGRAPDVLQRRISRYPIRAPAGGLRWQDSARTFERLLGAQAANADYEHPPDLREALLYVSIQRVLIMLQHDEGASGLFRVGQGSSAGRSHLCVLTLDPIAVARDDVVATAYLLTVSPEDVGRIPNAYRLEHRDFLRYVVDHEVFHCLDAMYLGPIPMSQNEFWAEYMLYRNEQGADAYAVAMHIREHGRLTPFVDNLERIRAMSLYSADPEHLTSGAIAAAGRQRPAELHDAGPREILALADRIREGLVPNYEGYLRFRAAACRVMQAIGVPVPEGEERLCRAAPVDEPEYRALRQSCQRRLGELFPE